MKIKAEKKTLREQVDTALTEVTAAEKALDSLLSELRVAPRSQKVAITTVLEKAFERLRSARSELATMRKVVG